LLDEIFLFLFLFLDRRHSLLFHLNLSPMLAAVRILVVEDDAKIGSFVVNGLKQSGFAVDLARDGLDALARTQTVAYDAAVVDVMLPKLDGLTLVQKLRAAGGRTPVLFLSAKASVDDRVSGLQAGGDDYLTKPFAFSELLARRGVEKIELQPREFALLEYLMRHPNRPVTKTMILEHIFDYSFDPQTNVVDVLVHRLRGKVDKDRAMIHTVRGVGYVLRA
jgi:two-component system, OmpR family, response regulator